MVALVTERQALDLRVEAMWEQMKTLNPRRYAKHLRDQQRAIQDTREYEQWKQTDEGKKLVEEVNAFCDTQQPYWDNWHAEQRQLWGIPDYAAARALLSVEAGATKREVRNAYRRKARKLHPDVGGDAEAFKQLYSAYRAVLKVAKE